MEKNEFCKIFKVDNGKSQVLITLENDEEDAESPYCVCQRTDYKGVKATVNFKYKTESKMKKGYKMYSQENAETFYKSVTEFINQK